MDSRTEFPNDLTSRPLSFDDIDDVVALANACELHDVGFTMWEREDLASDFRIDGVDPGVDTIGVWDGERLGGWAFVIRDRSAWADVHPRVRARGIGTALRRWTERRAAERGATRVGQTINDRADDAIAMFVAAGYTPTRTSWILSMAHPERPADPVIPEGIALRHYRPGDDEEALGMFEDAFAEAPDRTPSSLATWRAMTIEREAFAPEDLVLAVDGDEIVGGAFLVDSDEIWVDKLAVRRDHRERGIARAILQSAFQRGFDRGYPATSLSTDSDRSALTVYQKDRDAHPRVLYALRDRPVSALAVAEGFEPSESCPPTRFPGASLPRSGRPPRHFSGQPETLGSRTRRTHAGHRSEVVAVVVEPRRVETAEGVPVDQRRVVVPVCAVAQTLVVRVAIGTRYLDRHQKHPALASGHMDERVAIGAVDQAVGPQMHDHVDGEMTAVDECRTRAGASRNCRLTSAFTRNPRATSWVLAPSITESPMA